MAEDNKIVVELIVEGGQRFAKIVNDAGLSTEELAKTLDDLRKKTDGASESNRKMGKEFGTIRQKLRETTNELAGLNLELAEMADAGKRGTKEFADLEKKMSVLQNKAGTLKDAMVDANEQIIATGSDTRGIDRLVRVVSAASGAFQVFEGAAALAGKGNEDLQKALVKLNAVMAITSGWQQVATELTRQDSILKPILTKATMAYNLVVGQSTGALKAFRIALAATGIGLAVVGIVALVENWSKIKNILRGVNKELLKNNEYNQKRLELMNQSEDAFESELDLLKLQGVEEEKLIKLQRQRFQEKVIIAIAAVKSEEEILKAQEATFTKGVQRIQKLNKISILAGSTAALFLPSKSDIEDQKNRVKDQKAVLDELSNALLKFELGIKPEAQKNVVEKAGSITTSKIKDEKDAVEILGGTYKELRKEIGNFVGPVLSEVIPLGKSQQEAERAGVKIGEALRAGIDRGVSGGTNGGRVGFLDKVFSKAQEIYGQIQDTIGNTISIITNATQIRAEKEIQNLELKRKRGVISEKQYEREVAKIKNEAAQKEKRANVINAFAMIPMAILSAFTNTTGGIVVKGIAAGLAGAFAVAQAALVAASPVPKFFKGVLNLQSQQHPDGIDTVPAMLTKGESVMTRDETRKHYRVLKAIRERKFEAMYVPKDLAMSPVINMEKKIQQVKNTDYRLYEHLATMGSYMKQDYRANERSNELLKELIQTNRPKNRNA